MRQHFVNPHTPYMVPAQQQPMMMAPQQPQQNYQIGQLPNGQMVYLDQNGQVVGLVPTQQGAAMQYPQQQQPMMMRGAAMGGGRFTASQVATGAQNVPVQMSPTFAAPNMQQEPHSTNSRYGNIEQLTQSAPVQQFQPAPVREPVAPQYQPPQEKPMNHQPPAPVAKPAPTPVQPPAASTPDGIGDSRVKLEVRGIPFSKREISTQNDGPTTYGDSLYEIISAIRCEAHKDTSDKVAFVRSVLVCQKHYGISAGDIEAAVFKSDIETVYRALKRLAVDVNKKEVLCFFNSFNEWLTDAINDYLLIATKGDWRIESFYNDFNDLIAAIVESKNKELREGLIAAINDLLDQSGVDIAALREKDESGTAALEDDVAVIPNRTYVVYMKLMGYEIGDLGESTDPKSDALLRGLRDYVDTEVFYVTTLDRRLYKAYFTDSSIVFTRID